MSQIQPELIAKVASQQAGLNAAKRAMMLEDTRRILAKEDAVADAVHKRAFGSDYMPPGEDDMGEIHVGDKVSYQQPAQATQGNLMPMAMMALAASMPLTGAAGVIGYLLANRGQPVATQPQQPQQYDDSTVRIGLGRIEDLVQGSEE